jgi:cytochrome P450
MNSKLLDLGDPSLQEDPYPAYRQARAHGPVSLVPGLGLALFTHADCARLFRSRLFGHDALTSRTFKDLLVADPQSADDVQRLLRRRFFDETDPPDHMRLRRSVSPYFTRSAVERLRGLIEQWCQTELDALRGAETVELVNQFATKIPARAISVITGLPLADQRDLAKWSEEISVGLAAESDNPRHRLAGLYAAAAGLFGYLEEVIRDRRRMRTDADDLVQCLLAARKRGEMSEDELIGTLGVIVFGGYETTAGALVNGIAAFTQYPGEFEKLRRDPALNVAATEEVLRYGPPVLIQNRFALARAEVAPGVWIDEGESVFAVIGSANRDANVFVRPDDFDVSRGPDENPHLSFAVGSHLCLGAPLARVEIQAALKALAANFVEIGAASPAVYRPSVAIRLPTSFHVSVTWSSLPADPAS